VYPSLQLTQDLEPLPREDIPHKAQNFYHDFGLLVHPSTGLPVQQLTQYQQQIWDSTAKYRLVVKSQKVGLSTSALLEDFQRAITKPARGKDILVISQTQYHANEHLLTLKTHIINSEKYRKYLIREPSELLFKEEKTKVKVAYIKNPDNHLRPSRIIALGASEGAVWSWKNVAHIHMSDIAANDLKDDSPLFAAAFSRLANTGGTMLIETPPRGPRGKVFEIYQQALSHQNEFALFHVTAQEAVKEGLISQAFLDEEKRRLGALYPQYYESEFIAVSGNLFSQAAIDKCLQPTFYPLLRKNTEKYMAVDLGYISSKFAIIIAEWEPQLHKIRILKAEEITTPTYEQMLEKILRYYQQDYRNIMNIAVDATSRQEFAMSLKARLGEPSDWRHIHKKMTEYKARRWDLAKAMTVVPVLFNVETKGVMASHARQLLEDPRQLLAIDPRFNDLILFLRSAVFDDRGQLDKEMTPHNDIGDAFLMLMQFFRLKKRER